MRTANVAIFTNASMGATIHSLVVPIVSSYLYAIQLVWTTGSPICVGNFTVEVSCDPQTSSAGDPGDIVPTNWTTLANSSSAAGGASGDLLYNVNLAAYNWVRCTYTRASGTGTLNGRINCKGV